MDLWKNFRFEKINLIFSFFYCFYIWLCNRNSLAGLVNFFRYEKKSHFFIFASTFIEQKLISWTCRFFFLFNLKGKFHFLFLHLCNGSSLDGLVNFFKFRGRFIRSLSCCFLHLCNRNSLAGLVYSFRFEEGKIPL